MDSLPLATFALIALVRAAVLGTQPVTIAPIQFETGDNSSVNQQRTALATDPAAWRRLWLEHKGMASYEDREVSPSVVSSGLSEPEVDFRKSVILVYFAGVRTNLGGYELVAATQTDKHMRIRLAPVTLPGTNRLATTPFAFVQLPRSKQDIELQMPNGFDRDGQVIWRTVVTYPGPVKERRTP